MNFAQRLKETLQTGLDIGFKAGVQKGCDLWMAALAQEQLDRILEPVCGDRFTPFRDRNPDVKQFNYKRRERK